MHGWQRGLLLCLCLLSPLAMAAEVIENFAVRLQVQRDGNLLVTERITVQAEGEQIKRGIYRDLPVRYTLPTGLQQSSPIILLDALRDGQTERVRLEENGTWVRYYLGSADRLLQPGRYEYELRYRVERPLLHHSTTDELYWNVTGNGWGFPIQQASVEVQLPSGARMGQFAGAARRLPAPGQHAAIAGVSGADRGGGLAGGFGHAARFCRTQRRVAER